MLSEKNLEEVFKRLEASSFRRRFRLGELERRYLETKGLPTVLEHARGFVEERLAPATPRNDGKQTPYRGHPVFVGQHATATCCRGCLQKWHGISRGADLSDAEVAYVMKVLERWLHRDGDD